MPGFEQKTLVSEVNSLPICAAPIAHWEIENYHFCTGNVNFIGSGCSSDGRTVNFESEIWGLNPVISKFYLLSTELNIEK